MTTLTIAIVNWNTSEYLDKYIESIYKNTKRTAFEVIVADNNSTDNSVAILKNKYPQVRLIENKKDLYFVKAINQIIEKAQGEYILISTPDTLVMPDALDVLAEFMQKNNQAGAAGARLLNSDYSQQGNGENLPGFLYGLFEVCLFNTIFKNNFVKRSKIRAGWDRNDTREVETVSGACLMVRKEVLEQIGVLDENILMYFEDIDLCKRIRDVGYKIYLCHEASVMHHWGQGTKQESRQKNEKIFYESMLYYYKKHFGIVYSFLLWLILIFYTRPLLKTIRFFKAMLRIFK